MVHTMWSVPSYCLFMTFEFMHGGEQGESFPLSIMILQQSDNTSAPPHVGLNDQERSHTFDLSMKVHSRSVGAPERVGVIDFD